MDVKFGDSNNVNESNLYNICDKPEIEKTHLKFMKFILEVHSKSLMLVFMVNLANFLS